MLGTFNLQRIPVASHFSADRRVPPLLLSLLAVLTAGAAARAADAPMFDFKEKTLSNGLKVVTLEDFSCPIVAVELWYHVGSKDENPERQGFAHMFEHMMFRGTDRLGPTDHFDLIRRTGGDCNAHTAFDNTTYEDTLPANQLELALWLEAERMTYLKIDQGNFDTERKVVEEERRQGLNQPYGEVPEKLLDEVFKVHPYRWLPIGRIPHLRAAAVGELRDFWTRYYIPNNATLVIVGAVKHEEAQRLAEKYFGWIPRYDNPPRVTVKEPEPTEAHTLSIKANSAPAPVAGVLFRTVPVSHPDYVPLQLLATIVGGGESSRLYRELVADKQMAAFAVAAAFSLEQDGMFAAGGVLTPFSGKLKEVQSAIRAQIERVRTEPVSEEELTKARNQMLRNLVTQNLTVESKAAALGEAAVLEGETSRINQRLEAVRSATPADLQRVARTYLAPEREYDITIEQNLLGTLLGKKNSEDDAPITATPETQAPPVGRGDLTRPADWPTTAPAAPPLNFKPTPQFTTATLPNGLKVYVVPNHEVPFISIELGLLAGSWTESKPGVASMTLGMLTKGTKNYNDAKLAEEMESYGINIGGSADLDSAEVSGSCLTEHADRAMRLMSEVVLNPTFPPDEFEKFRQQARTGMAISDKNPKYQADRELRRRLFGEHPYARVASGELSDLDKIEAADLPAWWKQFARPDMAVLIFCGDIEQARAMELAEKAFGQWHSDGPRPTPTLAAIPPAQDTHIYLVDRPGLVQSEIRVGQIGLTRSAPEFFVSRVVSGYFGGAFSSRLNETIRVKKGLTYGASGGYSPGRFAGTFRVSTFSKTESTADAVKAIFEELDRLRSEAPSEDELSKTKSYIIGSFAGDRETPQAVAGDLWLIERENLPGDFFDKLLAGVSGTSAADSLKLVSATVDPKKVVVVVVGDASKIKADLEKIAPVTVVQPKDAGPADKAEEQ